MQCPFCKSRETSPSLMRDIKFNGRTFSYPKCCDCRLVFIYPKFSLDDYVVLYPTQYHDEFYFKEGIGSENAEIKSLQLLQKIVGNKKKLLDFGCGNGAFLKKAVSVGYKGIGIEFNSDLIEKLKKKFLGVSFFTPDEFNEIRGEKYDVLHMGDVLEHLTDPTGTLLSLLERANDEAYICMEGPIEANINLAAGVRALLLKIKNVLHLSASVAPPYHVLFSNYKNQKAYFERLGFQTLHYEVSETAWPFLGSVAQLKNYKQVVQFIIAQASIGLSRFIPGWGNRFIYIGRLIKNTKAYDV